VVFFDTFTLILVGIKDKNVSSNTDEFLKLMSKYYGIDINVYAICGFTFQVY